MGGRSVIFNVDGGFGGGGGSHGLVASFFFFFLIFFFFYYLLCRQIKYKYFTDELKKTYE